MVSHVLALIALALVVAAWAGVQFAWRKVFPDACADPDVLAGRMGCRGADCSRDCGRAPDADGPAGEEIR